MLEPDGRTLLLDALRPPMGYQLDAAAGTTYSLDLVSLLTAPVAFAMFDRQHADGSAIADPIAMLQALREHSERITLFHGAGQVTIPPIDQRLIVYLEQAVYTVVPPNPNAIFHPKVWYLRFRDRETGAISLRLLCLSRNLTPDRSWDTLLRLDGVPGDEVRHPELAAFADALVDLASQVRTLPEARAATVRSLGADLSRATWTLPDGFTSVQFWPLGHDGQERWPFDGQVDRMLIVSPFLTGGFISRVGRKRRNDILVSRPEEIDRVGGKALARLAERLVLASDANATPADLDAAETPGGGGIRWRPPHRPPCQDLRRGRGLEGPSLDRLRECDRRRVRGQRGVPGRAERPEAGLRRGRGDRRPQGPTRASQHPGALRRGVGGRAPQDRGRGRRRAARRAPPRHRRPPLRGGLQQDRRRQVAGRAPRLPHLRAPRSHGPRRDRAPGVAGHRGGRGRAHARDWESTSPRPSPSLRTASRPTSASRWRRVR